jgi:hypothetical protein
MKKKNLYTLFFVLLLGVTLCNGYAQIPNTTSTQGKNVQSKRELQIGKLSFAADRKDVRDLIKSRRGNPGFQKLISLRKNKRTPAKPKDKVDQSPIGNLAAGTQRICNINDIDLTNSFGIFNSDPHIALNPANQNDLVVSGVYTNTAYGLVTYTSASRGTSWSPGYYHSVPNSTIAIEHPTSAFSPNGNLYMAYHPFADTGNEHIIIKSSPTKGVTWPGPEVNVRTAPFPDYLMGTSLAIDYNSASPYYSTIYCAWAYMVAAPYGELALGELGFSGDGGANFYSVGQFTQNDCLDPYVETGSAGELYVAWNDFGINDNVSDHHIGFARLDVNTTTFTNPVFITMPPIDLVNDSYFNNLGQYTYPVIAVDKSGGPHNGRIYIVAASTSTFGSNHSDILMSYSDNNGDAWSTPVIVNQSAAGQCWNPWASVDKVTGELAISYYCFENPYYFNSSVYMANSLNGGASFTRAKVTDANFEFTQNAANPYYNLIGRSAIVAHNRQQNVAWTDQRNTNETRWKIYTSLSENHDIAGQSPVCNCEVFSVTNLAPNATVTWSASPSSAVTITPGSGGTATVCRVGGANQMITLSAVISGICNDLPFTREIMLGSPIINGTYISNGVEQPLQGWTGDPFSDINNVCFMQQTYTNMSIAGAASVNWTKIQSIPNQPISWHQNGNNLNLMLMSIGQRAVFGLTATNACGSNIKSFNFKSIDCSGGGGCQRFAVSPNPATGEIKVYLPAKIPPCARTTGAARIVISAVRIYDITGNLRRSFKNNNSTTATVNIRGLKTGVYLVEVGDGRYTERHRIIIRE